MPILLSLALLAASWGGDGGTIVITGEVSPMTAMAISLDAGDGEIVVVYSEHHVPWEPVEQRLVVEGLDVRFAMFYAPREWFAPREMVALR